MEERDLYFVDRALMDFAAAGEEGWEGREGDVRVKALWVHPIKVSERVYGVSCRRADGDVASRLMTSTRTLVSSDASTLLLYRNHADIPFQSCRGVSLQKSVITPQGLQVGFPTRLVDPSTTFRLH